MRKRLLMMAFAALSVASSFAYEVGEYAYNSTQRFKITGENLVTNGNFANGLDGWFGATTDAAPNAEVWSVEEGAGENGENAIKSLGATADEPLCGVWDVNVGTYIVSIDVKFPSATNTGVSSATAVDANCIDFFLNSDGAFKKIESTEELPVIGVAASTYCSGEEWKKLVFFFTASENQKLVMHIEKLATEAQISNVEIHEAQQVYDVRIAQKQINYAKQLMALPEFDIAEAADAKAELEGVISDIEGMIAGGAIDDESDAAAVMGDDGFAQYFEAFLSKSSSNMNGQLKGLDFTTLPATGRGRGFTASLVSNINFGGGDGNGTGGNWGKTGGSDTDWLMSAIQSGQPANTATFEVFNVDFPTGKYFFSAEMRNANTGSSAWPCPGQTFNLETTVKMGVGNNSIDAVISGEDYQRFYLFGDVAENGKFRGTIYWPGSGNSRPNCAFYLRDVQVRYVGEDPQAIIERKQAWDTFTEQWNAAVSNRNKLVAMVDAKEYPWAQDSLTNALNNWDKYYNEVIEKGWINSDLSDPGKAVVSNDELTDWAKYNGIEIYSEPDPETGDSKRLEYQLVRNYQWAITYVQEANKAITDLNASIKDAEATRDDAMNGSGDKTTYQKAIDAAQDLYNDIIANTTDEKREADEARITDQQTALAAAKEAFLKSAELKPIVSIDFANKATLKTAADETQYYSIAGATGEMTFAESIFNADNTESDNWLFQQGYKEELTDVLHVGGNGYGIVTFAESDIPTDDDVLRVQYDVWYGNLGKGYLTIDFLNAADEVVAGTSLCRYNGLVGYNDFNDDKGTGMDLLQAPGQGSSSVGNAGICVDNNKSSFDLIIDYKAKTVQGTLSVNGVKKSEGGLVPMKEITDNKIVKFRVGSTTYQSANSGAHARRCWFDNLVAYKYASQAEGPHQFVTLGDVNGDKAIDVADVVGIVNKILGEPNADFIEAAADVNGDGKIDVADVVATVNIILGE